MNDLANLLDDLVLTLKKYCVLPQHAAEAIVLWCAFTWTHEVAHASPILLIKSPIKRCGKTTLLRVVWHFVRRALMASSTTPAVVFRIIDRDAPTLMMDEADTYIHRSEDWRCIINGGHTRDTARVLRCDGKDFNPKEFSTWAPKVLAMIGKPADTILDRSIVIEMQRKLPGQTVRKLRRPDRAQLHQLRDALAKEIEPHLDTLRDATPELPSSLNDRAGDSWEPLLAIADLAGGHWPHTARLAAKALSGDEEKGATEDIELLANVRDVLASHEGDRIFSSDLVTLLTGRSDWRWAGDGIGDTLTEKQLAVHLDAFGIHPKTIRIESGVKRGYMLASFDDVFRRYLPPLPAASATPLHPVAPSFRPDRSELSHRALLSEDVHISIPNFHDLTVQ